MVGHKAVVAFLVLLSIFEQAVQADENDGGEVVVLTDDNYHLLSTGEWMVEFYAPWCPHCRQFAPVWKEFGRWAGDTTVRVAMVDVAEEPMLAGQFMISQLPTIYHIKDGEVREYDFRDRSLQGLEAFVEEAKWKDVDPIPWYWSPTSSHMKVLGMLFSAAQGAKVIEEYLRKEYKMETWQIFATVAAVTVLVGLAVGGICVLLGELCNRVCCQRKKRAKTRRRTPPPPPLAKATKTEASLEEERVPGDGGQQNDNDQQAKGDGGKPQDVAEGKQKDNTAKQKDGAGKEKGGDGKQDGDGGGARQRKGASKKKGKK